MWDVTGANITTTETVVLRIQVPFLLSIRPVSNLGNVLSAVFACPGVFTEVN